MIFPIARSVADIYLGGLKRAEIENIILDIDGTLVHLFHKKMREFPGVDPEIIGWIKTAKIYGFKLYILSNSSNEVKVKEIAKLCGIENYLARGTGKRWKPWRIGKALKKLGIDNPKKSVMIGNNPLWDFIAPKFCGMKSIWIFSPNLYVNQKQKG